MESKLLLIIFGIGSRTFFSKWGTEILVVIAPFIGIPLEIVKYWDDIKAGLGAVWNWIKTTVTSIFTAIGAFFTNIWTSISNTFNNALQAISSFCASIWNSISSTAKNIWNDFKSFIVNLWNNIKQSGKNAWTSLKNTVINLCTNIKQGVINIWNALLNWFGELPSKLYNYGSNMFSRMRDGVSSTIGNVKSSIESGINSALNFLASLPGKAWNYGEDFVNGIVKGIKSAVGAVEDAVGALAAKIRSYLHFSVPDEGPLVDYEKWMPDFMSGLADGINKNKHLVAEAVKGLSLGMKMNTNISAVAVPVRNSLKEKTQANSSVILNIENFNNYTEKDIEQLAYELEFCRKRMAMGKGGI
ncbi:hypothetical protein [Clostridium sp. DMHC 10]|uniref:phage tail protein n=1 Tax=Clostridium sp. DMHC 10 TaxID=747377 RepID=UPI000A424500|nr:hypothetical protein [Clostridium sp. DMHC 10]